MITTTWGARWQGSLSTSGNTTVLSLVSGSVLFGGACILGARILSNAATGNRYLIEAIPTSGPTLYIASFVPDSPAPYDGMVLTALPLNTSYNLTVYAETVESTNIGFTVTAIPFAVPQL